MERDFAWSYRNGMIKANVPADEYKAIPWDLYEKGDPGFLLDLYKRIAYRIGELGDAFADGPGRLAARWKFPESYFGDESASYWKRGSHGRLPDRPAEGPVFLCSRPFGECGPEPRDGIVEMTSVGERVLELVFGRHG
jgi:hypothetical protein